MRASVLIAFSLVSALGAQDPTALAEASAVDKEIQKLPNLPEATRDLAFREMLKRIGKEPKQFPQLPERM